MTLVKYNVGQELIKIVVLLKLETTCFVKSLIFEFK